MLIIYQIDLIHSILPSNFQKKEREQQKYLDDLLIMDPLNFEASYDSAS